MALGMNGFRSIVIKADAANTSIAPIRLSQNDQDGRRIVFELWDGAESIAATGLTARLLFGVGEGGYATMTAVSGAATATWAVDVPQEALQTAGVVRMAVEVASGSQAVCTRIFDAVVEPAIIDEDSPEAQDALSEFRAAIARLEDFTVPVPIANGGTGATTAAAARTALAVGKTQVNTVNITGIGSGRQAVTINMSGGNGCILAIKRGTMVEAVVVVDLWSNNLAIWGTLPSELCFVRSQASGNTGTFTIQNNISVAGSAVVIVGVGCTFETIVTTETAMTENFTRTIMDKFLPLAGGTMPGTIDLRSTNIDRDGANPSAHQTGRLYQMTDKDGERIGFVRTSQRSTGGISMDIAVFAETEGGSEVQNILTIDANKDGSRSFSMTDTKPWAKMMGCSAAQIAKNYSWTTTFTGSSCLVTISRGSYYAIGIIDYWSTGMHVLMQSSGAQSAGLPTITKSASSYSFTITNDHNSVAIAVNVISVPMEIVG